MDDKKKRKFLVPEADLIGFSGEDIITTSNVEDEWWCGDDNQETWPF